MLLYAYFTLKVDFKQNLTTTNHFFTNDDWQFRIGPSIRIESQIGRTIRNRIESRSFAGP